MVDILLDGVTIFVTYRWAILGFMMTILGCGLFAVEQFMGNQKDLKIRLLTAFGLGSAVLSLFSFVVVIVGHFWPILLRSGSVAILIFAAGILIKEWWLGRLNIGLSDYLIFGFSIFLVLLLRLSFLNHILLPPYSDSPVHYQIAIGFLHPESDSTLRLSLNNISNNYYHFGFHSLVVWLSLIANLRVENAISLLGQMFLVIAPISIYVLTYSITGSHGGAIFASVLATVGWSMPAFAVNWGKYPALSALTVMPALVASMILSVNDENGRSKTILWRLLLLFSISLLHTRILFCLLFVIVAAYLSKRINLEEPLSYSQAIRFSLLYVISLVPLYRLLTDFYNGLVVALVVLILLLFTFRSYPKFSAAIFFFTFFLWLAVIVPISRGGDNGQTLLDKQFVGMALYIPFSVIGGTGLASFTKEIQLAGRMRWLALFFFIGCALTNFSIKALLPDSCCNYFEEGDQKAFQWIRQSTPDQALFLISAFGNGNKSIGTDAGIWISPLTGKPANKLPYTADWSMPSELDGLCGLGAKEIYLYSSGEEYSFSVNQPLDAKRLRPIFESGDTVIYHLVGCPK